MDDETLLNCPKNLSLNTCIKSCHVIGRDQLQNLVFDATTLPMALIVNTDKAFGGVGGLHWTAFFIFQKMCLVQKGDIGWMSLCVVGEYFDSFANPYQSYQIKPPFRVIYSNPWLLQSSESAYCGNFCLYWLWRRCSGWAAVQIEKEFKRSLAYNEALVLKKYPKICQKKSSFLSCCSRKKSGI